MFHVYVKCFIYWVLDRDVSLKIFHFTLPTSVNVQLNHWWRLFVSKELGNAKFNVSLSFVLGGTVTGCVQLLYNKNDLHCRYNNILLKAGLTLQPV